MEAILDSSFIITCIRNRIDFLSQLEEQGFRVKVPREVIQEMKDLKMKSKTSHEDRTAIDVAFEIIEKSKVKKLRLPANKTVDDGLIEKGKKGCYIATLDRVIKREIPKKIVIFSSKGNVGVE
jgi:rRNA-processing protein FCF1